MGNLKINRELKNIDDDVSARVSKIRQLSQQQRDLKISSAQDKNVARILINELGGCKGDLDRKETALDNLTGLDDTQKSTRKNLLRQIGSAVSDIDASVCFLQAAIATFENIQAAKEEATKQAQAAKEKQEKATREEKAAEAKKRQEREAQ